MNVSHVWPPNWSNRAAILASVPVHMPLIWAVFRDASSRGIGRAGRQAQLIHTGFAGPDHPQLPQLAESGYLKAVFYRL